MDPLRPSLFRRLRGATPAIAVAGLVLGTAAMVRWDVVAPELALAQDPIEEVAEETGGMDEPVPYATDGAVGALTDPVEEIAEPESTETTPQIADPASEEPVPTTPPAVVLTPTPESTQQFPSGRWVLFDRWGQAVDAVVEPWCVDGRDHCPAFGEIEPSCVWVEWLGSMRVRIPYRLSDGDADSCYSPSGQDRQFWVAPPETIKDALPDAPYSLELVYWD